MVLKNCSFCEKDKPSSDFRDNRSMCKLCNNLQGKRYKRTKEGLVSVIYSHQKESSKRRGHKRPCYTVEELMAWIFKQNNFDEVYENWVSSNYDKMLSPSVDREDDYKGYTIGNLRRICTWSENKSRGESDMRIGKNNKNSRRVIKRTISGVIIDVFYSAAQASRETSIHRKCIGDCCSGRQNTAGGFKWSYADG